MTNRYFVQQGFETRWEVIGELLASSSSKAPYKTRWVEFDLYRTLNGTYVISRVGKSLQFHKKACKIVDRNNLKPLGEGSVLDPSAIACDNCNPTRDEEGGVYPETPRPFAMKTTTAKGVLAALMQVDDNNSEYLTNVATRLLIDAAELDEGIAEVLSNRIIE